MFRSRRGWLHAILVASPEADEAEAQRYWRARFAEHPDEIRQHDLTDRAAAEGEAENPRRRSWRHLLWLRLCITAAFGTATVVLAIVGAPADKVWYGVALTIVWILGSGFVWLRYVRS